MTRGRGRRRDRERDRDRERHREIGREMGTRRQRQRDRDGEIEREIGRQRQGDREIGRQVEGETEGDKDRETRRWTQMQVAEGSRGRPVTRKGCVRRGGRQVEGRCSVLSLPLESRGISNRGNQNIIVTRTVWGAISSL